MKFFKRDIIFLLLVSILLGSAFAKAVSYGANFYFKEKLVSLVGDYGEYDLIIQMSEDSKANGQLQLEKIIAESLVGAKYKEGPGIAQKANFFVSLPSEYKNKTVYENLEKMFSNIPGGVGISIITEPRLNIRGVPTGAVDMTMEQLQAISGVDFVYHSGPNIGVVLAGTDQIASVTSQVEAILNTNKMIEVSFPAGLEPENPVLLAENIVTALYKNLQPKIAKYVSVDSSNDDIAHLTSTMQELRKFLKAYQTKVFVTPEKNVQLAKGNTVVLQGEGEKKIEVGDALQKNNITVSLTEANANGSYTGVITQGDGSNLKSNLVYLLDKDKVAAYAGTATWQSPRDELLYALSQTEKITKELPSFAKESNIVSKLALDTLQSYNENETNVQRTLSNMDDAVISINSATEKLETVDVQAIQDRIDNSSKAMTKLLGTLRLVRLINPDVSLAIETLKETQEKMDAFGELLNGLNSVNEQAIATKNILSTMADNGNRLNSSLRAFNKGKTKENLIDANKRLTQLANTDFTNVSEALQTLQVSAPKLNDEEMNSSITLMNKMINGQVIPNKRLQIMIDHSIWLENIKPIVYGVVGHQNIGIFESNIGAIEPNVYLQAYQVLNEVQAVLAGLTAFVITLVLLAFDHTAVMSALRNQRLSNSVQKQQKGMIQSSKQLVKSIAYRENVYGMVVGAILLCFIFYFSGAGIPYVSWYLVPVIGMFFGLLIALITEKITPVSEEEIFAGKSLGMSFTEIMREIVIPNGRPGILERLNRQKLKFK